jgi:transposase
MSRPMADTPKRLARPQFTDEFKASAVRLVLDEGKTVSAAARDLDLTETALREWVKRARADRTQGRTGLTTAEREELARLRKENRILQEERDILKNSHGRLPTREVDESYVRRASAGRGRRLLVPRARKKMDPSAASAPRIVCPRREEHVR